MKNVFLFIVSTVIWGSTWFAITFQVAETDALVSVSYRFLLAGILLVLFCFVKKLPMKFTMKEHGLFLAQALFLFGFNYWFAYMAEETLTSGLVGLLFSTLVFMNILNSRVFLGEKFEPVVILAAGLGVVGITLVFENELSAFSFSNATSIGLLFAVGGAFTASLGNIIAAYNQKQKLPLMQTTAYSMLYSGIAMGIIALMSGKSFTVEYSMPFLVSFLYLTIFGSIISFLAFLTLISTIGVNRAGYIALVSPVLALLLSTFFEDYVWTLNALIGIVLIVAGNVLVLRVKERKAATAVQE